MVRGFVDREKRGALPERDSDLHPLSLAVTERRPAFDPIVFDAESTTDLPSFGIGTLEEVTPAVRWIVGSLLAIDRSPAEPNRTGRRQEQTGREPEHGRLASTIWADHAGPAGMYAEAEAVDRDPWGRRIGVGHVVEDEREIHVQLPPASESGFQANIPGTTYHLPTSHTTKERA